MIEVIKVVLGLVLVVAAMCFVVWVPPKELFVEHWEAMLRYLGVAIVGYILFG